jgi:hypothetical protein
VTAGAAPLEIAVHQGHERVVEALLEAKAYITDSSQV